MRNDERMDAIRCLLHVGHVNVRIRKRPEGDYTVAYFDVMDDESHTIVIVNSDGYVCYGSVELCDSYLVKALLYEFNKARNARA